MSAPVPNPLGAMGTEASPTQRRMVCLTCDDAVELAGSSVACGCGGAAARFGPSGWTYTGSAKIVMAMPVHEPEYQRMTERLVDVPDDELTHRAELDALP